MSKTSYVVAMGSNRRHHRHGAPRAVLAAATEALAKSKGVKVAAIAPVVITPALGPAGRDFANSAVLVRSKKAPRELLHLLKKLERGFGRRRTRRWGPRVLDLDIILWSEGIWVDSELAVPHPAFRERRFVLDPLISLVPDWRDPRDGVTIRQLRARLLRRKPVDPTPRAA